MFPSHIIYNMLGDISISDLHLQNADSWVNVFYSGSSFLRSLCDISLLFFQSPSDNIYVNPWAIILNIRRKIADLIRYF